MEHQLDSGKSTSLSTLNSIKVGWPTRLTMLARHTLFTVLGVEVFAHGQHLRCRIVLVFCRIKTFWARHKQRWEHETSRCYRICRNFRGRVFRWQGFNPGPV